jgi:putative ABC transport system permease protein
MDSTWRLALREIGFRKGDFLLGVLAVTAAVACLAASATLLKGHGAWMADLTEAHRESTLSLLRSVEDDYRKITKDMGYNVLVLNKAQDMAAYLDEGFASKHMPEEYVGKLAQSKVMTVRHLVPTLHQRLHWKEQGDLPVILLGARSEFPLSYRTAKSPLVEAVEKGTARIGHVLHEKLGINTGDTITLLGKEFNVTQVNTLQGNEDDISIWTHLEEAQALLNRPDEINAIMALSCHCDDASLAKIQNEICAILPDTQVVQLASQTTARAKARDRAAALNTETDEAQQAHQAELQQEREALAAWLVPLVMIGAILWVGFLMLGNVRVRRDEIGILRAVGYRTPAIMGLFLSRAAGMGFVGALLGLITGFLVGGLWGRWDGIPAETLALFPLDGPLLTPVLIGAPFLACVATWIPAVLAAQEDPAEVLRHD